MNPIARRVSAAAAFVLLFIVFSAPGQAQDTTPAKVDEIVKAEMKLQRVPGVSLAVVKGG